MMDAIGHQRSQIRLSYTAYSLFISLFFWDLSAIQYFPISTSSPEWLGEAYKLWCDEV